MISYKDVKKRPSGREHLHSTASETSIKPCSLGLAVFDDEFRLSANAGENDYTRDLTIAERCTLLRGLANLYLPVLLFVYMHDCYRFSCQERLTTSLHRITLRHSDRHHKAVILPYMLDVCRF